MSSYSRERRVLRLTEGDAAKLLNRGRVRASAPMMLAIRFRQADVVVCSGRIVKARRPWEAIGRVVPGGHGDVKIAIERALQRDRELVA